MKAYVPSLIQKATTVIDLFMIEKVFPSSQQVQGQEQPENALCLK